jgi:NAD(P)-dependent dehydrogenase (short-subunit alcohol dehydrogenase family)
MARYLITGVSRGIGRAVAGQLIEAGHEVIGLVRTPGGLADLALTDLLVADLADPATLATRLGSLPTELDGLVHAAGVVRPGLLDATSVEDFQVQFTVNVTAVAELTRLALPALRGRGATVVLLNSGSGLNVRPPLSVYGISKHALRAYADALRLEEPSVRVSTVFPGRTATDMQRVVRRAENGDFREADYLQVTTVAGVICQVLSLPPDGVVTDVTVRPAASARPAVPSPDAID